ncbi:MAG: hypothetical protein M3Z66_16655 [Chloroflexota bacterium]|nr:hypothetical protein [Chloroflexota bacterium]
MSSGDTGHRLRGILVLVKVLFGGESETPSHAFFDYAALWHQVARCGTIWHAMVCKEHSILRLSPETVRRIVRRSQLSGKPKTALAEQYPQEGLRMAEYPGIVFRDGPAGRRPGLAGHGLDVWEIVETIQNEGGNPQAAAAYLSINPTMVNAALDYYLDYKDEIDQWIDRNRALAADAETSWLRRQGNDLTA